MTAVDIISDMYMDLKDYCNTYLTDIVNSKGKLEEGYNCILDLTDRIGCDVIRFDFKDIEYKIQRIIYAESSKRLLLYCINYDGVSQKNYTTQIPFEEIGLDNMVKIVKNFYRIFRGTFKLN